MDTISANPGLNALLLNVLFTLVLLGLGIFLGKVVASGLTKIAKKTELEKKLRQSFVRLIISVIEWSIYLAFASFAVTQMNFQGLSPIVSKVMLVIPSVVASLFILSIGFAISVYLREIVEDAEIIGWKFLSLYIFYFINLVFGLYSLKIALILVDPLVTNILSVMLVGVVGISVAYTIVKKELRDPSRR